MKKIFIVLLCIVFMCSVFASCDEAEESKTDISVDDTSTSEQSDISEESKDFTIYFAARDESEGVLLDIIVRFYEDDEYKYFMADDDFDLLVVEYTDGVTQTFGEAFKEGKVTIADLDRFNIPYTKEPVKK